MSHTRYVIHILIAALLIVLPASSQAGGTYSVDGVNVLSAPVWSSGALGGTTLTLTQHPLDTPVSADTYARVTAALSAVGNNPRACALTELRVRAPVPVGALPLLRAPCLTNIRQLTVMVEGPDLATITTELLSLPLAASLVELEIISLLVPPPDAFATLTAGLPSLERLHVVVRTPVELTPYATALAQPQPAALRDVSLMSAPALPLSVSVWEPLARLPKLQVLSLPLSVLDLSAAEAVLGLGLGARLTTLSVHRIDIDAAIHLGQNAPTMQLKFGCEGNCDELHAAWSAARAGGAMKDGVVDSGVRLFHDADVRRLAGVTVIKGSVLIQGPIEDLSPLRGLTEIEGELRIFGTTLLRGVEGLGNLQRVGNRLQLARNEQLRSTEGLASLREVGTSITIPTCKAGNPRLTKISFPALERVGESVLISTKPGFLGDRGWSSDDPDCGVSYVNRVHVEPFRRLVYVGGHYTNGRGLPDTNPALFPLLESPPTDGP